ncbi:hypothetical protein pEaSNUABM49_00160 [Erwinia phage pEa_SNUABM_49]|nr:hypothetical protein pEaSNUABM49_00160 [Erwinia phage pEa_SNUABM_49]
MQKLNNIKSELSSVYLNAKDSIERYNILNEMEKYMNELRTNFVEKLNKAEEQGHGVLERLQNIVAEHCIPEYDVSEVMHDETVSLRHVINELGLDSLDEIEIIMSIEECFEVELPDYDLELCQTINDVIKLIQK